METQEIDPHSDARRPDEDELGRHWAEMVAYDWRDDLLDPRQDIYTLEDCLPAAAADATKQREHSMNQNATAAGAPQQRPLRYWVDYDRPHLPHLSPEERIDYFETRVRRVVINPLRRILNTEIQPTDDSSALLIFGVSLCCAIEAAGNFLTGGKKDNHGRFTAFLHRYLSPDFRTKRLGGLTYGDVLWKYFRNGLAHAFAVCHGGFEGAPTGPYFKAEPLHGVKVLEVNPTLLLDDYAAAFDRYLADVRRDVPNGDLFKKFDHVFKEVYIKGK